MECVRQKGVELVEGRRSGGVNTDKEALLPFMTAEKERGDEADMFYSWRERVENLKFGM